MMKEKIVVEISALSDIEAKVSNDTIVRIEGDENTTTGRLYKVAKGLSVKLGSLVPPEDREPSQPPACTEYNPDHIAWSHLLKGMWSTLGKRGADHNSLR